MTQEVSDQLDDDIQPAGEAEQQVEQDGEIEQSTDQAASDEAANDTDGEDDEVVVQIGDEQPEATAEDDFDGQPAPKWVKDLRKRNRELTAEVRRLKETRPQQADADPEIEVGEEPTLESCEYDPVAYKEKLHEWFQRKSKAEEAQRKKQEAEEKSREAWAERLSTYKRAAASLKVKDFDEAEDVVKETLNMTQQGIIIHGAKRPELVNYALGKNPKKLKELASISDPVKFAFAVAELEAQLKVTPRKQAPAPDRVVRSSAPVTGSVDSQLERLREEAARTGDMSKVIAYKRQIKARSA